VDLPVRSIFRINIFVPPASTHLVIMLHVHLKRAGEVLTCRIYREAEHAANGGTSSDLLPITHTEATIELVTFGAPTPLTHIAAHVVDEM